MRGLPLPVLSHDTPGASMSASSAASPARVPVDAGPWRIALPVLLFVAGFSVFFRGQILSGLDLNFGGGADSRLVFFLHESTFRWLTGAYDFLSPPFFFNQTATLGYTDAYLLSQLVYAPLRLAGIDGFLALTLLPAILCTIGYVFFFLTLRRVGVRPILAAVAALAYAFSNALYLKTFHLQMFALHLLPVVIYCAIVAVEELHGRPWRAYLCALLAGGLCGLLFSTAFYVAWFFGLDLILGVAVFAAFLWPLLTDWWRRGPRRVIALSTVATAAFLAALTPFVIIYRPVIETVAGRTVRDFLRRAPEPADIFNIGAGNLVWGDLIRMSGIVGAERLRTGELNVGMTPALLGLTIFAALLAAGRSRWTGTGSAVRRSMAITGAFISVAFFLLAVKVGNRTLFAIVYEIVPGASAIRAGYRGMLIAQLFAMIATACAAEQFLRRDGARRWANFVLFLALALMALEQVNLDRRTQFSRTRELAFLAKIPPAFTECSSFYVSDDPKRAASAVQTEAMMIALATDLPTVNGRSGISPPDWRLADTKSPGYTNRVLDWADRRGIRQGLCVFDPVALTWRPAPSS